MRDCLGTLFQDVPPLLACRGRRDSSLRRRFGGSLRARGFPFLRVVRFGRRQRGGTLALPLLSRAQFAENLASRHSCPAAHRFYPRRAPLREAWRGGSRRWADEDAARPANPARRSASGTLRCIIHARLAGRARPPRTAGKRAAPPLLRGGKDTRRDRPRARRA